MAGPTISGVMLARAQQRHDDSLDAMLEEIDIAATLAGLERTGVYYGIPCATCRIDVIPLPDGRCGWCNALIADCE